MVDYGNPMPTAIVPSPNAGVPGRGRADRREFLLSRVVPAPLASLFVADQLALLGDSVPAVARAGATPTAWRTSQRSVWEASAVLAGRGGTLTVELGPELAAYRECVARPAFLRRRT